MRIIRASELPFVPASHENPQAPGVWKKVLVQRDDLQIGRLQMINWARLPVGSSFAPHYHEDLQEVFVILSGRAEIRIGDETAMLEAGDAVIIDARAVHEMWNRSDAPTEYMALGVTSGQGGKTVVVGDAR